MAINSFAALVGKKVQKTVKFMGQDVDITKLTVAHVEAIQEQAKEIEKNPEKGFDVLKQIIRSSAVGAEDISDEDFANMPMDELTKLSNEIMKFSGVAGEGAGK
jgi:hypothetical protein